MTTCASIAFYINIVIFQLIMNCWSWPWNYFLLLQKIGSFCFLLSIHSLIYVWTNLNVDIRLCSFILLFVLLLILIYYGNRFTKCYFWFLLIIVISLCITEWSILKGIIFIIVGCNACNIKISSKYWYCNLLDVWDCENHAGNCDW